jgi:purine-cytosine permease-like protein
VSPTIVNWSHAGSPPPGAHLGTLSPLMTAIGIGWGISWVTWASDHSRFVPRSVPSGQVFCYSYIDMFVPSVWLAIPGATIGRLCHPVMDHLNSDAQICEYLGASLVNVT